MENSVFVITQGTRCGKKIVDKFLINNYKVLKTVTEQENDTLEAEEAEKQAMLTELAWNYQSVFSSKNIILNLKNYPHIRNFIIIYSAPQAETPIYRQDPIEIQKTIDFYIKSQLSITCELLNELSKDDTSSSLFLALEYSLNNPFRDFFKNFINTLLDDTSLTVNINAFEAGKETPESFADYVFSIVQDKKLKSKGKWFKQFRYTLF
ncbi:MAG: hypothetical protein FWC36_03370 [Spirochaetes bacterium]|nr:hypothetical protein [Spirochaetota bacterium]